MKKNVINISLSIILIVVAALILTKLLNNEGELVNSDEELVNNEEELVNSEGNFQEGSAIVITSMRLTELKKYEVNIYFETEREATNEQRKLIHSSRNIVSNPSEHSEKTLYRYMIYFPSEDVVETLVNNEDVFAILPQSDIKLKMH